MGMGSLPYGKSYFPRPLALLTGLVVVALAAAAGWFAADKLARDEVTVATAPAPAVDVHVGNAGLQLRAGWTVDKKVPKIPGLESADAKSLAPADGGRGRM